MAKLFKINLSRLGFMILLTLFGFLGLARNAEAIDLHLQYGFYFPDNRGANESSYSRGLKGGSVSGIGVGFPLNPNLFLDVDAILHPETAVTVDEGSYYKTTTTFKVSTTSFMLSMRYEGDFDNQDFYANVVGGVGYSIIETTDFKWSTSSYYGSSSLTSENTTESTLSLSYGLGLGYKFNQDWKLEVGYRLFYAGYSEPKYRPEIASRATWTQLFGDYNVSHDLLMTVSTRF